MSSVFYDRNQQLLSRYEFKPKNKYLRPAMSRIAAAKEASAVDKLFLFGFHCHLVHLTAPFGLLFS